jgi:hypothetical protein
MHCDHGRKMKKVVERGDPYRLVYQCCPVCGRCDAWTLTSTTDKTTTLKKGEEARSTFVEYMWNEASKATARH